MKRVRANRARQVGAAVDMVAVAVAIDAAMVADNAAGVNRFTQLIYFRKAVAAAAAFCFHGWVGLGERTK